MSESDNRIQLAAVMEDELYKYCSSDSLSEIGLHEIIERNGLESNNNHLRDYRFFLEACNNERVTEGIIRYLLEHFPAAASAIDGGWTPLHHACKNKNVALNIIQLLIDAYPDSVRTEDDEDRMPLHILCGCNNNKDDEGNATKICRLLIDKYPDAVDHVDSSGFLPIHFAAGLNTPEICRVLIEAHPGSEKMPDASNGFLPLHWACGRGSLATVEYLYRLFPANNIPSTLGLYSIHAAIAGTKYRAENTKHRNDPATAVDVVKFLLDSDPGQKLKQIQGNSLLRFACALKYNDSNIGAALQIIGAIYDAHPEAIEDDRIASDIDRYHQQVQSFINSELVFARQAKDLRLMTTPDDNGQLPLHRALQNSVRLGSIKLLVKGYPHAVQFPDNSSALPLHTACQHHDSTNIIQYLVGFDQSTLEAVDREGNTVLHYACRDAKYEMITLLLGKYDAVSVSKRNAQKKLPIELLWESNAVEDRESVEYMESIFQLLKTYPETVMNNNNDDITQQAELGVCPENEKKRKWGEV